MRVLTALAGLVAAGAYAVLLWLGYTQLMPAADGLLPFDLRPFGYSFAEATAYLEALSDQGAELIRGPVATADTVFPVSFAIFLALVCLRARPGRLAWIGVLLALGYGAADLLENAAILRLVDGSRPPDPLQVSGASVLTQVKFVLAGLAILTALIARMRAGRRR